MAQRCGGMAEHHARIHIARPAADVFAFLANPMNLPRWQPSLREAHREAPEMVRIMGGGVGAQGLSAHVRFVTDPVARQLSWAASTGVGCAGDLKVEEADGGAVLDLCLRLGPRAERPEAIRHWTGDPQLTLPEALQASLAAVKELCEGHTEGVTLVSGGTQSHPDQAPLRDSRPYGSEPAERGS